MDQRGLTRPGSGKSACDAGAVETGGGSGGGATATTTSLGSSGSPSTVGAAVTFIATVSPAPAGGTVAFSDGGSLISGCAAKPVVGGQATCVETFPIASSHSIVAEYSGTSGFSGSTSPTFTQVVQNETTGGGGSGTGGTGGSGSGGSTGGGSGGSTGGGGGGSAGGGSTVGTPKAGAPKVNGTTVSVPITCAGPSDVTCVIKLLLSASGGSKGSPRVVARAKGGAKKLTVGVATATIAGGGARTVSVSLDGAGKKALAQSHHLKATLTATQKGGTKPLLVRSVTFKKR
jgi:Bacterial Ig-like domain (group 3)